MNQKKALPKGGREGPKLPSYKREEYGYGKGLEAFPGKEFHARRKIPPFSIDPPLAYPRGMWFWVLVAWSLLSPAWAGDLTQRLLAGEAPPPPARDEAPPAPHYDPDRPVVSRDFSPRSLGLDEQGARRFQAALQAYFFRDYPTAARLWRSLAKAGHARSQAQLGWLLQNGLGVAKDLAAARRWYRAAAEQGNAVAQNNLAALLEHGEGGPRDEAAARRWYEAAARQDYPPAQYNLAQMLLDGRGGPADAAAARRWLRRAAASGLEQAKSRLAALVEEAGGDQ